MSLPGSSSGSSSAGSSPPDSSPAPETQSGSGPGSGDHPATAGGLRPETVAVWAGRPKAPGSPLNSPVTLASNFRDGGDRTYSRGESTETIADLEAAVGLLEGGFGVAYASGMAAVSAILDDLPTGAEVVAPQGCYQGVTMALAHGAEHRGWKIDFLEASNTDAWLARIAARPDLVWLESPLNPTMTVADLPTICATAADALVPCAVDNTFATPLLQRPLDLGATWSVHSVTKFIGGHSDLLGGMVVTGSTERRDALIRRQVLGGGTIGALEAFLALRGLRTLPVRLARAQATTMELANRLDDHPAVTRVRYPGLVNDPGHDLAVASMTGPGAVLSFETIGTAAELERALAELRVITVATSLGGVESTIERRARLAGQEHVPATLCRLSVGCEHPLDLWGDLDHLLGKLRLN